jgi:hypothetical protein
MRKYRSVRDENVWVLFFCISPEILFGECCFQQGVHGFDILGLGSRESLLLMCPFLDFPFLVHWIANTYFP